MGELGVDGRIIDRGVRMCNRLNLLRIRPNGQFLTVISFRILAISSLVKQGWKGAVPTGAHRISTCDFFPA